MGFSLNIMELRMSIIDAVIPTYCPTDRLFALLSILQEQTVPLRHIYLINTEEAGFSKALTEQKLDSSSFAARYPQVQVRHIRKEEFDHGFARNLGMQMAEDADFVLLMTQDALPADRELVRSLLAPFAKDAQMAVTYARQLPEKDAGVTERLTRSFNYPAQSRTKSQQDFSALGIKTYFCSNVCALYKKEIFDRLGGFVQPAIFNEDMIYAGTALQAGYHSAYQAEARVIHSHNYTPMQQFHRNFDLGVSQAEHPEIFQAASSEGEGVQYVKNVIGMLKKEHAAGEIPGFVAGCAARLLGYKLGKNYRRLPRRWVLRFTMSPNYWQKNKF